MEEINGIIFDTDHFAIHDGPGIRTVIYLKGCPLKCVWCHNPESQEREPQLLHIPNKCRHCGTCRGEGCLNGAVVMCGRKVTATGVIDEVIGDKVFFEKSGGGVTISGGEPLFQPGFIKELLKILKENKIHTIVETSGAGDWQTINDISGYTDIFYYDIKCLDERKDMEYTGSGNKIIIENLKKLVKHRKGKGIVIRVPLIPGYNDFIEDINKIYVFAKDLGIYEIHLLSYNSSAPAKYEWLSREYIPGDLKPQDEVCLKKLRDMAPDGILIKVF